MTKEETAALFARVEERLKEAKRYVMGFVILDVAETETLRALAQAGRDDPEMDATDFAHPAWWRGEERAFSRACEHVNAILDGRDAGHGTSREPWHSTRQRLVALAQAKGGGKDLGDEPYDSQPAPEGPERVWLWDFHEGMTYSLTQSAWGRHEYVRADLAAPPAPPSPSPAIEMAVKQADAKMGTAREALEILRAKRPPSPSPWPSEEGWLPNALCPTDGVWRLHKLPDGKEVVAGFTGNFLGPGARRWQVKELAYHTPSRETGQMRGGVKQMAAAFDTFVITDLPTGVYPTHFRPNDTVHGAPNLSGPPPQREAEDEAK